MKKLIAGLIAFVSILVLTHPGKAPAQAPASWGILYVTNGSTTVPTNFIAGTGVTTTNIYAQRVTILGKASPRVDNTSTCYIGTTSGNDTQPYPVLSGGEVILRAPDGKKFNLRDWWVDVGTINDGITIIYQ